MRAGKIRVNPERKSKDTIPQQTGLAENLHKRSTTQHQYSVITEESGTARVEQPRNIHAQFDHHAAGAGVQDWDDVQILLPSKGIRLSSLKDVSSRDSPNRKSVRISETDHYA